MLKRVRIRLRFRRHASHTHLFEDFLNGDGPFAGTALGDSLPPFAMVPEDEPEEEEEENQQTEILCDGRLRLTPDTYSLSYEETELTGMEGSDTQVSFLRSQPGLVSMLRSGAVNTALVFEEGRRHICSYQTPLMPFEVCVHTRTVDNRLTNDGVLRLDYFVEIRGAEAEHCRIELKVWEA